MPPAAPLPQASGRELLDAALVDAVAVTDAALEALLPRPEGPGARVAEAMRYAVFAGGKRLRPFLVLAGARMFGAGGAGAARTAAAIECLHTYSLVHDDLPCMDDDDLRRGRPTTHKAFDEATAVLAGDALLTFAFELLADPATHADGAVRARLVSRLAQAGGSAGMIGGQMLDIDAETNPEAHDEAAVVRLQALKTGALFEFSCEAGAILAQAGPEAEARMREFARHFGLAFQVSDDLIDATGDAQAAGKAVGKDAAAGKATLVSLRGVEAARAEVRRLADLAAETLQPFGPAASVLQALPYYLLDRAA